MRALINKNYFCSVKRKKKFTLENILVTGYAAEGKSIARVDGKVIFIEGAVPGDVVDVFVSKSKKDWAEGKASKIKEFSSERVKPFCAHFGAKMYSFWSLWRLQMANVAL